MCLCRILFLHTLSTCLEKVNDEHGKMFYENVEKLPRQLEPKPDEGLLIDALAQYPRGKVQKNGQKI